MILMVAFIVVMVVVIARSEEKFATFLFGYGLPSGVSLAFAIWGIPDGWPVLSVVYGVIGMLPVVNYIWGFLSIFAAMVMLVVHYMPIVLGN